jgi:hypothetical protein
VLHTRREPVFVIGSARSGTSLTCRLLLDHLGVNFGCESQFFIRYYRRLAAYGDLRRDDRMRLLLHDISGERFFARTQRNFGFVLDVERAFAALRDRTYPDALRAIFEQFAAQQGLSRWGDKTPEYSNHLFRLLEMFPDAQFVHVLRDGRDVATSMFRSSFGPKNAYEAAIAWRRTLTDIWRFAEVLPPRRFHQIRYEDLVADPAAVLTTLARFLGVVDADEIVQACAGSLRARVRDVASERWRVTLSRREIACFEAFAARELERGGFPLISGHSGPSLMHGVCAGYWKMQGGWRRLRMRKYWEDNWYKLQLRARAALLPWRRIAGRTRVA